MDAASARESIAARLLPTGYAVPRGMHAVERTAARRRALGYPLEPAAR